MGGFSQLKSDLALETKDRPERDFGSSADDHVACGCAYNGYYTDNWPYYPYYGGYYPYSYPYYGFAGLDPSRRPFRRPSW
jgi:hypothetical protein